MKSGAIGRYSSRVTTAPFSTDMVPVMSVERVRFELPSLIVTSHVLSFPDWLEMVTRKGSEPCWADGAKTASTFTEVFPGFR